MSFPLYRRPGGVAFLDDDFAYLEMLADVLPERWAVRLFLRPADFINTLQQEPPLWDADAWRHREMLDHWREGRSLIPHLLQYWQSDGLRRFALHRVAVVDYSMPAMNGLQVLDELVNWPGARVLLTGRADEQIAVSAFNRGLIEQYLPKQSAEISQRLTATVEALLLAAHEPYQQNWRITLAREQLAVLAAPAVGEALQALSQMHDWVEHVVIGDPFGVLALDARGQVVWLQLETAERLSALAELAQQQGLDAGAQQAIREGRQLLDVELLLALGLPAESARLREAQLLCPRPALWASVVQLPDTLCPGERLSYAAYAAARAHRQVEEHASPR